jgi:hypothetical protein
MKLRVSLVKVPMGLFIKPDTEKQVKLVSFIAWMSRWVVKLTVLVAIKKFKESDDDEIVKKTTLREVKMLRNLK